jgi:hypothetical protein
LNDPKAVAPVKYTLRQRGIAELARELGERERSIHRGLVFMAVGSPLSSAGGVGMLIFLLWHWPGGSAAWGLLLGISAFLLVFAALIWRSLAALRRYGFARAALERWAAGSGFGLRDGAHFRAGSEGSCAVCLSGTTVEDESLDGFTFLRELGSNATLAGEVAHPFDSKSDVAADLEGALRAIEDQLRSELRRTVGPA